MAKVKEGGDSYKEMFEPTKEEVNDLKQKLLGYEQKRINGKLQSRFEQYCKVNGVIYFNEFGDTVVTNPTEYTRLRAINELVRGLEARETEAYLQTHPEEAVKAKEKADEMRASMAARFSVPPVVIDEGESADGIPF